MKDFFEYVLFRIAVRIFCNFPYPQYIYNWCYMRRIQSLLRSFGYSLRFAHGFPMGFVPV